MIMIILTSLKLKQMLDGPLWGMPVDSPSKQAVCTKIAGKKMYTYKTAYKNI